jgi:hypothetical protein
MTEALQVLLQQLRLDVGGLEHRVRAISGPPWEPERLCAISLLVRPSAIKSPSRLP